MFAFSGIPLRLHFSLAPAMPHSFFHSARYCRTLELHWRVVVGHLDVQLPCPNMFIYVRSCLLSGLGYHELFAPSNMWVSHVDFHLGPGRNDIHAFWFCEQKITPCVNAI